MVVVEVEVEVVVVLVLVLGVKSMSLCSALEQSLTMLTTCERAIAKDSPKQNIS